MIAPKEVSTEAFDVASTVRIKRYNMYFRWFWPHWLKSLFLVIKHYRSFDILWIGNVLPLGTIALFTKFVFRKKFAVFMHGMDFALAIRDPWKKLLTNKILAHAEVVIVNSRALERRVNEFVNEAETLVVYPCVDTRVVQIRELKEKKKTQVLTLLSVSRLVGRKGHHKVFEAIAKLIKNGSVTNIRYLIVGSGMEYNSLLRHMHNLKLDNHVEFFQNVSDAQLPDFYASSDIFVMPTETAGPDMEGFGIVYHEAGLSELPVIASKLPGVDEAVIHGKTGILVEPGNIDQIAGAIKLLAENPGIREQLAQAAKKRIKEEFVWERQAEKLRPFM